jgi:hypothetical protein
LAEPRRREQITSRLALVWCASAILALLLALANQWFWFGIVVWVMLLLGVAIGYGPHCRRKTILAGLTGMFLLYSAFLLGIARTYQPKEEVSLFLGLPAPTALLIYGIWPCGVLLGVLYAVEFHRAVLPEDKLQKFLAEFGRKE